jgi:hypothetical protein
VRGPRLALACPSEPVASAKRSKLLSNFLSLSRMMNRGPVANAVASLSCCAVHEEEGWRVTPRWTTRRVAR